MIRFAEALAKAQISWNDQIKRLSPEVEKCSISKASLLEASVILRVINKRTEKRAEFDAKCPHNPSNPHRDRPRPQDRNEIRNSLSLMSDKSSGAVEARPLIRLKSKGAADRAADRVIKALEQCNLVNFEDPGGSRPAGVLITKAAQDAIECHAVDIETVHPDLTIKMITDVLSSWGKEIDDCFDSSLGRSFRDYLTRKHQATPEFVRKDYISEDIVKGLRLLRSHQMCILIGGFEDSGCEVIRKACDHLSPRSRKERIEIAERFGLLDPGGATISEFGKAVMKRMNVELDVLLNPVRNPPVESPATAKEPISIVKDS